MKLIYLAFLLLISSGVVNAQSNYKPGYVIKANGDSINGYINYQEWGVSPKVIDFKSNISNKEPMRFNPSALQSFVIAGLEKYITYDGRISMDKNSFPGLPEQLDTTTTKDNVFIKVAYDGFPLSLLQHQDKIKTRFFIKESGDATPVELKYYQYLDQNNKVKSVERYKGILLGLAKKYNETDVSLENAIDRTDFSNSDLKRVLRRINNDNSKIESKSVVRFFAGVTLININTKFSGASLFNGMSSSSFFPRISIGADVFNNSNTQKIVFRGELSYFAIKPHFETLELTGATATSTDDYKGKFDQKTISFTPQIIYNFYNKEKFKVFAGIGIGVNYSMYSNNQLYRIKQTYPDYYKLESIWLNFPIQAGVSINKTVDVYGVYTAPSDYNRGASDNIKNTIYGLGVRCFLK